MPNDKANRTDQTGATVVEVHVTDGGYEIEVDLGGGMLVTAEHTGAPGAEDPPVKGDEAYMVRGEGKGTWVICGYGRLSTPEALPGEIKFVGRDDSGGTVCAFHMRRDGSIVLNGVVIDKDGNISAPGSMSADGSVTALASGAQVVLDNHIHPHPMGPTSNAVTPAG